MCILTRQLKYIRKYLQNLGSIKINVNKNTLQTMKKRLLPLPLDKTIF